MINSTRGSIFFSSIFCILFLVGPIVIVLSEEVVHKKNDTKKFKLQDFISSFFLSDNLITHSIVLIIIFTVRFIELYSGTCMCVLTSFVLMIADLTMRIVIYSAFGIEPRGSGPVSVLWFFYLVYLVIFPTVKSILIHVNEKTFMLISLLFILYLGGIQSICSSLLGIIFFFILAHKFFDIRKS